jgi:potassium efflux system protein
MIALAVFMSQILNPVKGPPYQFIEKHSGHWLARTRYIWYSLAVGLPLLLAGLSLAGYFYTAIILTDSLINTLWLVLGIIALRELIVRWLVLTRRKLALQVAREKQEAELVSLEEQEESQSIADLPPVEIEVSDINLAAVDTQTRQLLSTGLVVSAAIGLWLIWNDVFPALGIFDQITLWQHTTTIDGVEQLQPITLENLALALIIGFLTVVFTRNMPGLLEVILLQRLSLTAGSRYAITSLVRYTLVAVGIIAVFGIMGWKWSQIQWLLAALSVGLGFGLQEIVANFICGIIILFERPIRVGDRITIGDTTGIVSKIRIRATTITNWDKQELLVPNKEFITGRLLNWSLSDQLNRIVIPIGIAYGSDVPGALKLLEEAATENENVLEDPQPVITFEGFGDNSLNLIMRCYLESLDNRLTTISNLHQAINRKFEDAGICIAFPQRDIHLDTSRPLDINIHHISGNSGKTAD